MKPMIAQFKYWIESVLTGNHLMHSFNNPSAYSRMSSMGADPADVAHFDKRAAELLTKARAAHDELAAYLRSRKDGA